MLICTAAASLISACSIQGFAVNRVADAMSGQGNTFTSDSDPEFIKDAIPFGLKFYESILEQTPDHEGLILTLAEGYVSYAFMLQQEAEVLDETDRKAARRLRERVADMYLRGRDYALRGLELNHEGIRQALTAKGTTDLSGPLSRTDEEDVALLYWAGAGWTGAASAARDNLNLLADLNRAAALVDRSMDLDEEFYRGAARVFLISYEGGRPGGSAAKAREHYRRAVELSGGNSATVHVALAEAVVVGEQDVEEFRRLLDKALAVDVDAAPSIRLENVLAQQKARWLKTQIPNLFFIEEDGT